MEFIELDLENANESELINAIEKNNLKLVNILHNIELLETKQHTNKEAKKNNIHKIPNENETDNFTENNDNTNFEDEIDYYFTTINRFGNNEDLYENILLSLPSKKNSNYKNIILRIKMELLKNIKDISDLLNEEQEELTTEILEDFKNEVSLNNSKIKIIDQIEKDKSEIEEAKEIQNNLIFVPTSSGNIRVLEEIYDIPQEYFDGFKGLFTSIIDGSFKNVKRFNSSNNKNNGISEVKDYKIRVVFDRIGPNDYAVITAFIKKSDKDKGYLEALNLKIKNYEAQKEKLKANLSNHKFMDMQNKYTNTLLEMLNSNEIAPHMYRKGEK